MSEIVIEWMLLVHYASNYELTIQMSNLLTLLSVKIKDKYTEILYDFLLVPTSDANLMNYCNYYTINVIVWCYKRNSEVTSDVNVYRFFLHG